MLSCCAGALSLWTPSTLAIPSHPVPHIDSVLPLSTAPGGAQFTLTVNGTDFVAASTVSWSATALATTFVSTQQLTAIVPAPLIAASGTGWITVFNPAPGGGTSNLAFLPVGNTSAHVNFALFPLTAGTSPVGVAQGDFNGDGKLDLVTTNYVAGNLSIFLGNGDGTFQAPQTISIGSNTNPVGIVAADFDGDGNLDLAIGYDYQNSHGVSVLLGNGNGTFQPNQDFAAGTRTYELVSGDFNGDGFADIAVTNYAGNRVEVLLGNGDGTLQTAVPYSVTASAFYVQEADLNGDGTLDLVVCGRGTGVISVLLGNGDGTFQGQSTYTAGTAAEDVAIADFDGDGIPDVIATGTTTMFFLKGVGDGTFLTAVPIPVGFGTFVDSFWRLQLRWKARPCRHKKLRWRRRAARQWRRHVSNRPIFPRRLPYVWNRDRQFHQQRRACHRHHGLLYKLISTFFCRPCRSLLRASILEARPWASPPARRISPSQTPRPNS